MASFIFSLFLVVFSSRRTCPFSVNITNVLYCGQTQTPQVFDKDPSTCYLGKSCSPRPFLKFTFEEYFISHVIGRECKDDKDLIGKMAGFRIELNDKHGHKFDCGSWPWFKGYHYVPEFYRVNCQDTLKPTTGMLVTFSQLQPLHIAEFEVYTLSKSKDVPYFGYWGCFTTIAGFEEDADNVEECARKCLIRSSDFAGLKGKRCACASNLNVENELATHKCDTKCKSKDGVEYSCGGKENFGVFRITIQLPTYMSCLLYSGHILKMKHKPERVLENDQNLTVQKCIKRCDHEIYAYLLEGSICECHHEIQIIASSDECKLLCPGDPNEICGGRDTASVYRTCKGHFRLPCSQTLKCENEPDKYGICGGSCSIGFKGEYCISRDISKSVKKDCIGDKPCANRRNVICVLKDLSFDCICLKGFSYRSGGHCDDIDECELAVCDFQTSTCINLLGSYYCECRDEAFRVSNYTCIDNSTEEFFEETWSAFDIFILILVPVLSSAATVGIYNFVTLVMLPR